MAVHKLLHLRSKTSDTPVAIKLNLQDNFIRIGAPYHIVLELQINVFNSHMVSVSNSYGCKMFSIHTVGQQANRMSVQFKHGTPQQINFHETLPLHGEIVSENQVAIPFELMGNEPVSAIEKTMVAAALVACSQEVAIFNETIAAWHTFV